jgi:hypothetical protein
MHAPSAGRSGGTAQTCQQTVVFITGGRWRGGGRRGCWSIKRCP